MSPERKALLARITALKAELREAQKDLFKLDCMERWAREDAALKAPWIEKNDSA